eukprot:GHVS01058174.1.p2 GENE.GHVS01058174.1~~GHVS01058174.1.p2  ORF type:complete len:116 (+),score=1.64 GHVS01058174.1:225-572(+)
MSGHRAGRRVLRLLSTGLLESRSFALMSGEVEPTDKPAAKGKRPEFDWGSSTACLRLPIIPYACRCTHWNTASRAITLNGRLNGGNRIDDPLWSGVCRCDKDIFAQLERLHNITQ